MYNFLLNSKNKSSIEFFSLFFFLFIGFITFFYSSLYSLVFLFTFMVFFSPFMCFKFVRYPIVLLALTDLIIYASKNLYDRDLI